MRVSGEAYHLRLIANRKLIHKNFQIGSILSIFDLGILILGIIGQLQIEAVLIHHP